MPAPKAPQPKHFTSSSLGAVENTLSQAGDHQVVSECSEKSHEQRGHLFGPLRAAKTQKNETNPRAYPEEMGFIKTLYVKVRSFSWLPPQFPETRWGRELSQPSWATRLRDGNLELLYKELAEGSSLYLGFGPPTSVLRSNSFCPM